MNDEEERHEIFKTQLYPFASLSKLEFQGKLELFKENNPDYANEERIDPHISKSELRKFIRDRKSY
jgi:hypothetical protein